MTFYRHAIDMKLKESEERLKLALASSNMGMWSEMWRPTRYSGPPNVMTYSG